ncbi:MAG: Carboxymuconolactone decarboxylase [Solirubrobacterales bacterium]|nr:Carboxymuconolactone decarboxylase [Solirubrobacterales bacterium]
MTESHQDRRARGVAAFASQFDLPEGEVVAFMDNMLGPCMAEEAQRANAAAWTDDALSMRDRSLVVIASLVTQGGVEPRLRGHLQWAIRNGVTRAELDALMAMLAVYVGYPKASTGMQLLREELGPGEGEAGDAR